jgi:hypothetical protein
MADGIEETFAEPPNRPAFGRGKECYAAYRVSHELLSQLRTLPEKDYRGASLETALGSIRRFAWPAW